MCKVSECDMSINNFTQTLIMGKTFVEIGIEINLAFNELGTVSFVKQFNLNNPQ